jgi:hypothetical protein
MQGGCQLLGPRISRCNQSSVTSLAASANILLISPTRAGRVPVPKSVRLPSLESVTETYQ